MVMGGEGAGSTPSRVSNGERPGAPKSRAGLESVPANAMPAPVTNCLRLITLAPVESVHSSWFTVHSLPRVDDRQCYRMNVIWFSVRSSQLSVIGSRDVVSHV